MTKKAAIICTIATILILSFHINTVFSYNEWNTETLSIVNVRENSEVNGRIISTLSKNHPVLVVGEQGNWYKIKVELEGSEISGWIYKEYLGKVTIKQSQAKDSEPTEIAGKTDTRGKTADQPPNTKTTFNTEKSIGLYQALPFKGITSSAVNMRKAPEISAGIIMLLPHGQELTIVEEVGSWYRVSFETDSYSFSGWVNKSFVKKAEKQQEEPAEIIKAPQKTEQPSANVSEVPQTHSPAVSAKEDSVLQDIVEKVSSEIKTAPVEDKAQKVIEPENISSTAPSAMETGTMIKPKTSETREKGVVEVFATIINLIFALFACIALLCSIKALNAVKTLTALLNEFKDEK